MLSALAKAHRAHERKQVSWDATLYQDGRIWGCKTVDLSNGGAKIRINERLAINSWVVLVIERLGTFPGEVRWQDKGLAGISFLEDAAVVEERLQLISPTKEIMMRIRSLWLGAHRAAWGALALSIGFLIAGSLW